MRGSRISFILSCVLSVLSIFVAVYYFIAYREDRDFNMTVSLLTGLSGIACAVLSFIGLGNIGATVLGMCDFFGMLLFLRIYYPVVIDSDIMSGSITITPEIANLITITAILLVSSIVANVLAWQRGSQY